MPWWWPRRRRSPLLTADEAAQRLARLLAPAFDQTPALRAGFVVGGAVRDALLGRDPVDLDWLVADPEATARALADAGDAALVELDRTRRHYRVVWRGSAASWDFAPPEDAASDPRAPGVLERDLRRRDLTLNAIAFDPQRGALVDPLGGVADLRRRRVRALSLHNLRADPLRTLRVVRIAAQLGFTIDAATRREVSMVAAELAAGALPLPAAERIGAELDAILSTASAGRALRALDELGLLALTLPELAEGRGVAQGSLHHLDVLDHQLEALQQLIDGFPDADLALRWATLLHDLGKPRSRTPGAVTEDGLKLRERFLGHDRIGAEMARELLARLRRPREQSERVAALVAAHMRQLPEPGRAAQRFVHRTRALLPDLLQLMLADREAARGPAASALGRRRYRERVGAVLEVLAATPAAAPLIGGGELMRALELAPGPRIGALLAEIAEAQALGDVLTREEALAYAARRHLELSAAAAESNPDASQATPTLGPASG